jgi:hypothetical protein
MEFVLPSRADCTLAVFTGAQEKGRGDPTCLQDADPTRSLRGFLYFTLVCTD